MLLQRRRGMIGADGDVGKALVVAHQHVEAGLQPFDEIGFKQERFSLGAGDDHFQRDCLGDHAVDGVGMAAALCVLADAVFQALGLADVKHLAAGPEHAINAGPRRQPGPGVADRVHALDDIGRGVAGKIAKRGQGGFVSAAHRIVEVIAFLEAAPAA
jgi:hypothetical protein